MMMKKMKYYNKWNWGNSRMLVWIVAKKIKKIDKIIYQHKPNT